MKIGLISDTHNYFPEQLPEIFSEMDIILHAGDISEISVIEKLRQIAPVEAVYGNCDIYNLAHLFPSKVSLQYEALNFFITHNIGKIQQFNWKILRGQITPRPDIVIFGHTHVPYYENHNGIIFINPGSAKAGRQGYPASVKILEISSGRILSQKMIELETKKNPS